MLKARGHGFTAPLFILTFYFYHGVTIMLRHGKPDPHKGGYKAIGVESVKVTGDPDSCTHTVKGSLPSCSVA